MMLLEKDSQGRNLALRRQLLPERPQIGKMSPFPFLGGKEEVENHARPHPCLLPPGEGELTARVMEFAVKWLARRGHSLFPLQGERVRVRADNQSVCIFAAN